MSVQSAATSGRSRPRPSGPLALAAALAVFMASVIAGCGGGGLGSGGTGAPLSVGSGTITGFGSVVVDGVALDDRNARTVTEASDGSLVAAPAELGQRVDLELDEAGLPRLLRVDAQLVGPIAEVQPLRGRIVVLGRTVELNASALAGPSTVLSGAVALGSLSRGQWLEVHGVEGVALLTGEPLLQATRVKVLPAVPAALRVSGRIDAVEAGGRLRLGALGVDTAAAQRLPAGGAAQAGDRVTVLARPADLGGTASAPLLVARVLVSRPAAVDGQRVVLAGKLRAGHGSGTLVLDGQTLNTSAAAIVGGPLQPGQYLRVEGLSTGPRQVQATRIVVRQGSPDGDVELRGTVVALAADRRSFRVRDTRVSLPATGLRLQDCEQGLSEGLFVEVKGNVDGDGVLASRVECARSEPDGAVVEREGMAGAVDVASRSLVLTPPGRVGQRVQWSDLTLFRDLLPSVASLQGQSLEVEGVLRADGVLLARRIRPAD